MFNLWSWFSFSFEYFNDLFFFEIILLILSLFFIFEKSIFYCLSLLFILFFFFGVYILYYQFELIVAFFWLAELTVIFVFIISLMHLQSQTTFNLKIIFLKNYFLLFFIIFFIIMFYNNIDILNNFFLFINTSQDIHLTYYLYLLNVNNTDLYGLFLSFYLINFFEFLNLIFLILVVTLILIKFYSILLFFKNLYIISFFNNFFNFTFFFNFFFKRSQDLYKQNKERQIFKTFSYKK
jgi:hypothetical protein